MLHLLAAVLVEAGQVAADCLYQVLIDTGFCQSELFLCHIAVITPALGLIPAPYPDMPVIGVETPCPLWQFDTRYWI